MLARIAKRLTSHKGKQHIVAVAVRKGKVIGVGFNSYNKTHPEQARLARGVGQDERIYLRVDEIRRFKDRHTEYTRSCGGS